MKVSEKKESNEVLDVNEIWKNICEVINNSDYVFVSVAFFDFPNSSKLKKTLGQKRSIRIILFHNQICKHFIHKFGGHVVKELGDGLLTVFDDPFNACMCSIKIKAVLNFYNLATKIAITSGYVQEIKSDSGIDIFGLAVDKCSRIEQQLQPNQILIDDNSYNIIRKSLEKLSGIQLSSYCIFKLKDFGPTKIFLIQ